MDRNLAAAAAFLADQVSRLMEQLNRGELTADELVHLVQVGGTLDAYRVALADANA